ncbi:hypothetical protein GA707_14660 [Nostocoides sp. F2B08]|uniref:hypothetical protein n=1 Tax=Nostocoides sp. F2B08 TaxID=2653936 RepID=UPI0012638D8A|nr:hypothetical protein [Tetrasphaera sp. F2B08]KAB7743336.1 hypothetical protein GA707_14660 [Tetrasphaera sp. F2B08]
MSALKAVIAQAAASLTTLLLSVVIARTGGTSALGNFAVAMAILMLAQAVAREATIVTLVTRAPTMQLIRERCERQSLIGLVASAVMIGGAALTGSTIMLIVGVGAHGILLASYGRLVSLTLWRGRLAIGQELLLLTCVLVPAAGSVLWGWNGQHALTVWVASSAAVGYLTAWRLRMHLRPRWGGAGRESRVGGVFAAQSLLTAGSVHVLTIVVAIATGPVVVGALRGAGTVLGPANLILTALQPVVVRHLSPLRHGTRRQMVSRLAGLTGVLAAGYATVALAMVATALVYGEVLLGSAWVDVEPIIWISLVDGVLNVLSFVPAAAHRSFWEHRRSSAFAVLAVILRFPLVLGGAVTAGAKGAALGLAVSTGALCVAWWISAVRLDIAQPREEDVAG